MRTPKREPKSDARRDSVSEPAPIRLWVRLTLPGAGLIGPGKIQLLRLIDEHESISGAARAMRMSYRRAWLLVDELNGLFKRPLVEKWFGGRARGGARLTPTGQELLRTYAAVVDRADRTTRKLLDELLPSLRPRKR